MAAASQGQTGFEPLRDREKEVLQLLAQGLSNQDIAERLVISIETVRWHNRQIYSKLDAHNRTQAVAHARQANLIAGPTIAARREFALPKHNLPSVTTPFVGREREQHELQALLADPQVRLVTITGTGGTGKTRLGLQVAAALQAQFADGVWLVELAPISDPGRVMAEIASMFKLREDAENTLGEILQQYLSGRTLLLLLDNYEHLMAAATLVSDLLAAAPGLKILVTSREVLRIQGEREYALMPLALPEIGPHQSAESLSHYESVAFFLQCAQAVNRHFEINEHNHVAIAEVCRRLDGLPLAIELAATRIRFLSPEDLLQQLENRLQMLKGGPRDLPHRQQTIRDTITWSYDLLDGDEQRLFARLAVFHGGATLDAIDHVCIHNLAFGVIDGIEALLTKSLVMLDAGPEDEPRFIMLETLREYAWERLHEHGETALCQRRHAEYFAELAEYARPFTTVGGQQVRWLARLEAEHDNLRAALAWSLGGADKEIGQRMVGVLMHFWQWRGRHREWAEWLDLAMDDLEAAPTIVQAHVMGSRGLNAWILGDSEIGLNQLTAARKLYEKLGELEFAAACAIVPSMIVASQPGGYDEGKQIIEEAIAYAHATKNRNLLLRLLTSLSAIERRQGKLDAAYNVTEECLALCVDLGDQIRRSQSIFSLGHLAFSVDNHLQAERLYREGLELALAIDYKSDILQGLQVFARLAIVRNQLERAAVLLAFSAAAQEAMGFWRNSQDQTQFDQQCAVLRERLGTEQFDVAWSRGRAMSFDQGMAYTLAEA